MTALAARSRSPPGPQDFLRLSYLSELPTAKQFSLLRVMHLNRRTTTTVDIPLLD